MGKKVFLLLVIFVFMFLSSGCATAKGTGGASGQDDVNYINKADAWVKKNLW